MSLYWSMILACLIGLVLSQQPAINAATATVLSSGFAAAALSLGLSSLIVLAIYWITGGQTQPAAFLALPWWSLLAAVIGAAFVAGSTILVPITGVTLFFLCLIAGQLIGSIVADMVGAFGLEQKPLTLRKLSGVALAFIGVLLVRLE